LLVTTSPDASAASPATAPPFAVPATDALAGVSARVAYVAPLDGLRALAVLGVMAFHAGVPGAAAGELGVDLFFAMSGFLITGLLLVEFRQMGTVRLGRFYARRFLRLMPAYFLYAAFITALLLSGHWPFDAAGTAWSRPAFIGALWVYLFNYVPLGGLWNLQFLTGHLWSLSVEEQFYFLWPSVLLLGVRLRRPLALAVAVVAAVMIHRAFVPDNEGHLLLLVRGIGLVIGSAVAVATLHPRRGSFAAALTAPAIRNTIAASVLAGLAVASRAPHGRMFSAYLPFLSLAFALLVAMLWVRQDDWLGRALSPRPLTYIGKISYGVYLYHMVAHTLTWHWLLSGIEAWPRYPKFALRLVVFAGLSIGLAAASHAIYERPFLKLKNRFR
jgi:peptidoglycan/LPS O-acetylase OafA/YrhL